MATNIVDCNSLFSYGSVFNSFVNNNKYISRMGRQLSWKIKEILVGVCLIKNA